MRTIFKLTLLFICFAALANCASSDKFTMTYSTQGLPRGKADINASTFKYLPADKDRVSQNQIENTAWHGSILLDMNVGDYVRRAFMMELERNGYYSNTPKTLLDCDIAQFKCDDLGNSVDWYFDISCRFIDNNTKTEVASESANIVKKGMVKFGGLENLQRGMNSLIFEGYEKIIGSQKVQQILKQ